MRGPQRYLVAGPTHELVALIDRLADDPQADVVSVAPRAGPPERLVVVMDPARAAALREELGDQALVEPDTSLEPFDGPRTAGG
jgi:hypothetical protein